MDPNEILARILRRYGVLTDNIRATQIVESKIRKKVATYADAEDMAVKIGQALTTALKENLPDALTDGMLYRAVAEVVVERPLKTAGGDVSKIATAIQQQLNEEAGIGIKPIVPEMNQDQIDGIITGICNADSYQAGASEMFTQLENCLEGYVDDFVRENADFQYKAGLSPKIVRQTVGKCCEWCSRLAGTYEYEDVKDRGNDVFRRHKNCHCIVSYNPGDGSKRRRNVHSREWTNEGRNDRIAKAEAENESTTAIQPEQRIVETAFREQQNTKKNVLSDVVREYPQVLKNYTPETMYEFLVNAGYTPKPLNRGGLKGVNFRDGGGYKINFDGDGEFQYHPETGSHHAGEYWKISGGKGAITRYDRNGIEKQKDGD